MCTLWQALLFLIEHIFHFDSIITAWISNYIFSRLLFLAWLFSFQLVFFPRGAAATFEFCILGRIGLMLMRCIRRVFLYFNFLKRKKMSCDSFAPFLPAVIIFISFCLLTHFLSTLRHHFGPGRYVFIFAFVIYLSFLWCVNIEICVSWIVYMESQNVD